MSFSDVALPIVWRRTRPPLKPESRTMLADFYNKNHYPNLEERTELAEKAGRTEQQIQVWFQNRRNRQRNKNVIIEKPKGLPGPQIRKRRSTGATQEVPEPPRKKQQSRPSQEGLQVPKVRAPQSKVSSSGLSGPAKEIPQNSPIEGSQPVTHQQGFPPKVGEQQSSSSQEVSRSEIRESQLIAPQQAFLGYQVSVPDPQESARREPQSSASSQDPLRSHRESQSITTPLGLTGSQIRELQPINPWPQLRKSSQGITGPQITEAQPSICSQGLPGFQMRESQKNMPSQPLPELQIIEPQFSTLPQGILGPQLREAQPSVPPQGIPGPEVMEVQQSTPPQGLSVPQVREPQPSVPPQRLASPQHSNVSWAHHGHMYNYYDYWQRGFYFSPYYYINFI